MRTAWDSVTNLTIPFRLRGSEGSVAIELGVNEDPRRLGYHLLGLPYDLEIALGFPKVRASVSFAGDGYAAAMGWIQVLRYGGGRLGDERTEVDLPPQHREANTPYYSWGIEPTFFDAPSMPHEGVTWTAETFLATSPDVVMTRTIQPICGFR